MTRAGGAVAAVVIPQVRGLGHLLFDLEVRHRSRMPSRGRLVVAANHYSHMDPVMVTAAAGRNVHYLAVDELFGRSRMFDGLIRFFGAIPTSRTRAPLGALRRALHLLEREEPVGLFPEGRRVAAWGDEPPKRGAAWLAMRTGAPLVPVAVEGTEHCLSLTERRFRRSAVRLTVLEPIDPGEAAGAADPLGALMEAWQAAISSVLGPARVLP